MGVPKFFRWISHRYPCINQTVEKNEHMEFDHVYLDMNGIIHNCSHPDDKNLHFIEESVIFRNIELYLSNIFERLRPQKTFFIAVDGVAPRAKSVQQRARRFQSAKEQEKKKNEAIRKGIDLSPFDSNCISPGTEFMDRLNKRLQKFVLAKVQNDPLWRQITVILSGHDCPGEGEHKIREYMSHRRTLDDYRPNERHCIYGMDADLIFLALTTHELSICIFRENVLKAKTCDARNMHFSLTHISILRDYIELEFDELKDSLEFGYDLERLVDDWVFMAYLLGNDFIPHLPNMHIHADTLNLLWDTYKVVLPQLTGYITEYGIINIARMHEFLKELSKFDLDWFREAEEGNRWIKGKHGAKMADELEKLGKKDISQTKPPSRSTEKKDKNADNEATFVGLFGDNDEEVKSSSSEDDEMNVFAALDQLNISSTDKKDTNSSKCDLTPFQFENGGASESEEFDEEDDNDDDLIMYNMYRRSYYQTKLGFDVTPGTEACPDVMRMVAEYVRMLQWIMHYYYTAVPDWDYIYPFHYAPFTVDLLVYTKKLSEQDVADDSWAQFDSSTEPVLPMVLQMLILPPNSDVLVPKPFRHLLSYEEQNPLVRYFPRDYSTDLNDKLATWEAVVLIPFIEAKEMVEHLEPLLPKLTAYEKERNVHASHLVCPPFIASTDDVQLVEEGFFRKRVLRSSERISEIYQMPERRLDPRLPTLNLMKYGYSLVDCSLHVFESPRQCKSMQLSIKETPLIENAESDLESLAKKILGKPLRFRWPHSIIGLPVRIVYNFVCYELEDLNSEPLQQDNSAKIHKVALGGERPQYWQSVRWCNDRLHHLRDKRKFYRNLTLEGEPRGLIFCRRLTEWTINTNTRTGSYHLKPVFAPFSSVQPVKSLQNARYARKGHSNQPALLDEDPTRFNADLHVDLLNFVDIQTPIMVPSATAVANNERYELEHPIPLAHVYAHGQLALNFDSKNFGDIVKIMSFNDKNEAMVIRYPKQGKNINMKSLCDAYESEMSKQFFSTSQIATKLRIPASVVGRLSNSVRVDLTHQANNSKHLEKEKSQSIGSTPDPNDDTVPLMSANAFKARRQNFHYHHPNDSIESKKIDIGFNLRYKSKSQTIGWAYFNDELDIWLFSSQFVLKVQEYMRKFPEVISCLARKEGRVLLDTDIFPNDTKNEFNKLQRFLEETQCQKAPVISRQSDMLSEEWILKLNQHLKHPRKSSAGVSDSKSGSAEGDDPVETTTSLSWLPTSAPKQEDLVAVDHMKLYTTMSSGQNLIPYNADVFTDMTDLSHLNLFTRVINLRQNGYVPFGATGTVIAVMRTETTVKSVEVLFDNSFVGSMDVRKSGPYVAELKPSDIVRIFKESEVNLIVNSATIRQKNNACSQPQKPIDNKKMTDEGGNLTLEKPKVCLNWPSKNTSDAKPLDNLNDLQLLNVNQSQPSSHKSTTKPQQQTKSRAEEKNSNPRPRSTRNAGDKHVIPRDRAGDKEQTNGSNTVNLDMNTLAQMLPNVGSKLEVGEPDDFASHIPPPPTAWKRRGGPQHSYANRKPFRPKQLLQSQKTRQMPPIPVNMMAPQAPPMPISMPLVGQFPTNNLMEANPDMWNHNPTSPPELIYTGFSAMPSPPVQWTDNTAGALHYPGGAPSEPRPLIPFNFDGDCPAPPPANHLGSHLQQESAPPAAHTLPKPISTAPSATSKHFIPAQVSMKLFKVEPDEPPKPK